MADSPDNATLSRRATFWRIPSAMPAGVSIFSSPAASAPVRNSNDRVLLEMEAQFRAIQSRRDEMLDMAAGRLPVPELDAKNFKERFDAATCDRDLMQQRICAVPATSIEGLKTKARMASALSGTIASSLIQDLLAL